MKDCILCLSSTLCWLDVGEYSSADRYHNDYPSHHSSNDGFLWGQEDGQLHEKSHALENEEKTFKVQDIQESCALLVMRKAVVTWLVLKNSDGM